MKLDELLKAQSRFDARTQALAETLSRLDEAVIEASQALDTVRSEQSALQDQTELSHALNIARQDAENKRQTVTAARSSLDEEKRNRAAREGRERNISRDLSDWIRRHAESKTRIERLQKDQHITAEALEKASHTPATFEDKRLNLLDSLATAEKRLTEARDKLQAAENSRRDADLKERAMEQEAATAREQRAGAGARLEASQLRKDEIEAQILNETGSDPEALGRRLKEEAIATPADAAGAESLLSGLERERDQLGAVNLRAEEEAGEYQDRLETLSRERLDLTTAIAKLRDGIDELNAEGRERLLAAFDVINEHFKTLFVALFGGGSAELRLVESDDPLEAGLEIFACPPGKRLSTMSLMSGGEQALTATALIFGVFLA
ncbi:MAG: chromosome segregation protein SMC, partial [Asticcacaulis sp. 32-58-5]